MELSGNLECLPDHIAEDGFLTDDKNQKEAYFCANGHTLSNLRMIKEGYSSTEEKKTKYST